MRSLTALLCLTFAVLLFSAGEGFALPPCPEDPTQRFHNCFGTLTWPSGQEYVGEWRDDKKNGQGTSTYANGDKYVGEHRDGEFHGQGTYYFLANNEFKGDKYVGEWRDDKRNGQGTYFWADGRVWHGLWRNDAWGSGKQYAAGQAPYEIYAARGVDAPPQVAERERREAEQEGLAAERERERLRQERIAAEKRAEARQQIEQERLAAERERERLQRERAQLAAEQERLRVERERLAAEQAVSEPELEPLDTAFVTVKNANVREQPDVQSSRVATLPIGSEITALAKVKHKNWYLVAREGEKLGYVFGTLLAEGVVVEEEPERDVAENRHAVAVIIGNKTYDETTPAVDFAHNDAEAIRAFVRDTLGYREGNVLVRHDSTKARLENMFGIAGNHRGRLDDLVRPDKSDVFVFYSGHGVPGLEDRRGYLLPVDGNPRRAELTGYPLDLLYENLGKLTARSVTVVLDACFSGETPKGFLVRGVSGAMPNPHSLDDGVALTILTAAHSDQMATWDSGRKLGLFTAHFLDGVGGIADGEEWGNGDGKVTLAELQSYLDDEMTYQARRQKNTQQAYIMGDPDTVLATYQH